MQCEHKLMCKIVKGSRLAATPLLLLLVVALASGLAHANTISFTDYGIASENITLYNSTSQIGVYPSNASIGLDGSDNYVMVFTPVASIDYFNNPWALVDLILAYIPQLLVIVAFVFIGAGVAILIKSVV
jgi:hypothetical protein